MGPDLFAAKLTRLLHLSSFIMTMILFPSVLPSEYGDKDWRVAKGTWFKSPDTIINLNPEYGFASLDDTECGCRQLNTFGPY